MTSSFYVFNTFIVFGSLLLLISIILQMKYACILSLWTISLVNVYKRYSRRQAERNPITVTQGQVVLPSPTLSIYYSYQMCGVDVADMKVSNYSMEIRNKKWWMPCLLFYMNMVLNNACTIHNIINNNNKISGKLLRMKLTQQIIGNTSFRQTKGRKRTNISVY